jgi:signal transduction histidine kinase
VKKGADAYLEKSHISVGVPLDEFHHVIEHAWDSRQARIRQVHLEQEVHQKNQELEATVAELQQARNTLLDERDKLRDLERMRVDFYSMITHDLRNPATAIVGFTELLGEGTVGPLNPAQAELVSMIDRSANKLLKLINDYLDYSAIDAGFLRLNCQEVHLDQIVSEAVHEAQPLAYQRHHILEAKLPPDPVVVKVDGERIAQVIANLLSNAIKYTPDGGRITVTLEVQEDQFVIAVSDTGMGISADQIPLLFSMYRRLSGQQTRRIQGTGLGLHIVKEIVKAHDGDITVESELGGGSTFRVILPRITPCMRP